MFKKFMSVKKLWHEWVLGAAVITECTAAVPHTSLCPRFTACNAGTKSYSGHEFFHCLSQTPAFSCFGCNCFKAIVCSFSAVLPGKDLLMWQNYYLHRLSDTKNQSHPQPGSSFLNVASKALFKLYLFLSKYRLYLDSFCSESPSTVSRSRRIPLWI